MSFTDEEMKRLKDCEGGWYLSQHTVLAIFARLEAAENCIPYHECQDDLATCPHLIAWRKAAGRDNPNNLKLKQEDTDPC